ncbi:MAG: hypothetical protein H0V09_00490 [Gemmatimonadetes bacterium]|nr:hypothetical protein [Gemmatimonadota bacterium]
MLTVRVIRTPSSAIPEEFDALAAEPDVELVFTDRPDELGAPDMVVLPGSEATIPDTLFLRASGMDAAIRRAAENGSLIFGICGGFQMMGTELSDPDGLESDTPRAEGLGIFEMATTFTRDRIDERVDASGPSGGAGGEGGFLPQDARVTGFELHGGRSVVRPTSEVVPLFDRATGGSPECPLGIATRDYAAMGTYLHGVLADPIFRKRILEHLRARRAARQAVPDAASSRLR